MKTFWRAEAKKRLQLEIIQIIMKGEGAGEMTLSG
jgi:hypothetical protein